MSKHSKNTNLPKHRLRISPQFLGGVIFVGLFAIVGSYYLLFSRAETLPTNALIDVDNSLYDKSFKAGDIVSVPIQINSYRLDSSVMPRILWVSLTHDTSRLTHVQTICGNLFACNNVQWSAKPDYSFSTGTAVCLDLRPGTYSGTLLTVNYKALTNVDAKSEYFAYGAYSAPGSCAANPSAIGGQQVWHEGSCNYASGAACDNGPDIRGTSPELLNFGLKAQSDDTSSQTASNNTTAGKASTTKNKKSNGASGGATATDQSNYGNTVPSSGAQSTEDSTNTVNPSPFYDGKQYGAGSDAQTTFGAVKVANHAVQTYWVILAGSIVAAGTVAFLLWRRRQSLPKRARKR